MFLFLKKLTFLLFLTQLLFHIRTLSIPVRGKYPWTVLLCKLYDIEDEPEPFDYFTRWFFENTDGSVQSYFRDLSNGLYSIEGSNVYGWFSIPYTKASIDSLASADTKLSKYKSSEQKMFHKTKQLCRETAQAFNFDIQKRVITIINDGSFAIFCSEDGVLLSPSYIMTAALAHEMIHSHHIGHSFSDKLLRIYPHSKLGEYDDKYDLMSTSNAFMYPTGFGMSGPGLSGPHLDYLGWLPMHRLLYFGRRGEKTGVYRLTSLSTRHEDTSGNLLIYVPYDQNNPLNYYTIELRTKTAIDQGIPEDGLVAIHRIKDFKSHLFSFLITGPNKDYAWRAGQTYTARLGHSSEDNFIQIRILYIDPHEHWADIGIKSDFDPTRCASNEILRNAYPGDTVCIHWKDKDLILASNGLNSQRQITEGLCSPGFIPRRAGSNDNICVTPSEKNVTDAQNERWNRRKSFFNKATFGVNACKPGFTWRRIDNYDFTCVRYDAKRTARQQSSNHPRRRLSGAACKADFVWRESFPGDRVCVTRDESLEAKELTLNGQYRQIYRRFFNGIDSVDK